MLISSRHEEYYERSDPSSNEYNGDNGQNALEARVHRLALEMRILASKERARFGIGGSVVVVVAKGVVIVGVAAIRALSSVCGILLGLIVQTVED